MYKYRKLHVCFCLCIRSDQCAIGREIQLSIKIENVNDKPSVGRGTLNQPLLNIKAPSLPYELKNDNGGFDIRDVARRGKTTKVKLKLKLREI